MTEPQPDPIDEPTPPPARTGNARVDAVLESVEGLADLPVADQVALFENAHEELRGALDAPALSPNEATQSDQPPGA
jgi:hypothetical protein